MRAARFDSYGSLINSLTGLGGVYDSLNALRIRQPRQYTRHYLDSLYQNIWACRKVCDYKPGMMAKGWGRIVCESGDQQILNQIDSFTQKELKTKYWWGQCLANKDGGSIIIRLVDDGEDANEPINLEKAREISYSRVFDRWEVIPEPLSIQDNPYDPEYYQLWTNYGTGKTAERTSQGFEVPSNRVSSRTSHGLEVSSSPVSSLIAQKIHKSRIIRFRGARISPEAMQYNQGWEDSLLIPFIEPCLRYFEAMGYVSSSVSTFETMVLAIQNLFSKIQSEEGRAEIRERLELNQQQMSALRGIAIDRDTENMQMVSRRYNGVSDILERLREEMVAASGLTKPQLISEHPAGLAATGESERLAEAEAIKAEQINKWQDSITTDIQIYLAVNNYQLNDWQWEWNSLFQLTKEEESNIYSKYSQADNIYLNNGVLTAEEIRRSRFANKTFSQDIILEDLEELKSKIAEEKNIPRERLDGLTKAELIHLSTINKL